GQLAVLCRHHHRMKDEERRLTGWSLAQPPPGPLEWERPTGRIYHVRTTPPPPVRRTRRAEQPPRVVPPPAAPAAGRAGAPTRPTRPTRPTPTVRTPTATTSPPSWPASGRRPATATRRSSPHP